MTTEKQTIFLTGGTGFLGKALVPMLLESGYAVRMLVRKTSVTDWCEELDGVNLVVGDVTDKKSLVRGMEGCEAVIHAAGLFKFWGKRADFERVNVLGTQNVVYAALEVGVKRFVHVSTLAVIGAPEVEIITEDTVPAPREDYQETKLLGEQYVLEKVATGLPAVVIRPGGFYGPGSRYGLNRLMFEEGLRGWLVKIDGGKNYIFAQVFHSDVAQGCLLALQKGRVGEIYNICDTSIPHNDFYRLVSQAAGISAWRFNAPRWLYMIVATLMEGVAVITKKEPFYSFNLRYYLFYDWKASNEKARKELGFVPKDLKEGVAETVTWYKGFLPFWRREKGK
jgi:nucleoside-diphosphate-sugar epimerase